MDAEGDARKGARAGRARRPTDAQRAASRRNGAKSHGPTTEAGKRIAAMNRLAHGLYSSSEVAITRGLLREDHLQVTDFLNEIVAALAPRDVREYLAAREVAQAYLWSARLHRYQTAAVQGAAILSPEVLATVGGDPVQFAVTERGLDLLDEAIDHFEGSSPDPFQSQLMGWQAAVLFLLTHLPGGDHTHADLLDLDAEDSVWTDKLRQLLDDRFDGYADARAWIRHQRLISRIQEQRAAGRPEAFAATRILSVLDKALDHMSRIDRHLQRAIDRYDALRLRTLLDEDDGTEGDAD